MKKDYKSPTVKELVTGNILPIYTNYKNEEDYEGDAVLIKKQHANLEELPYIRIEVGGTSKQEPHTINWSYQRWLVKFVKGPLKGFKTNRYISYYLSTNSNIKSQYTRDPFENMTEKEFEEYMEQNNGIWDNNHFEDEE